MFGSTTEDCREAKDTYGLLQTIPLPGYPLRSFGQPQVEGATYLLGDYYTTIFPLGGCTTCAQGTYRTLPIRVSLLPEVCDPNVRAALIRGVGAYLRSQRSPADAAMSSFGAAYELLALALDRERSPGALVAWLNLATMFGSAAGTPRISASVIYLGKVGATADVRAAATSAARAIGAASAPPPPTTQQPPSPSPPTNASSMHPLVAVVGALGLAAIAGHLAGRHVRKRRAANR